MSLESQMYEPQHPPNSVRLGPQAKWKRKRPGLIEQMPDSLQLYPPIQRWTATEQQWVHDKLFIHKPCIHLPTA